MSLFRTVIPIGNPIEKWSEIFVVWPLACVTSGSTNPMCPPSVSAAAAGETASPIVMTPRAIKPHTNLWRRIGTLLLDMMQVLGLHLTIEPHRTCFGIRTQLQTQIVRSACRAGAGGSLTGKYWGDERGDRRSNRM